MPLNVTANSEPVFTRTPTIMDWDAQLNIAIDGQSNWIPVGEAKLDVVVTADKPSA